MVREKIQIQDKKNMWVVRDLFGNQPSAIELTVYILFPAYTLAHSRSAPNVITSRLLFQASYGFSCNTIYLPLGEAG